MAHAALSGLEGSWTGTNYLWLRPDLPPQESVSLAEVTTVAGGNFLSLVYNWAEENGPQDGLLLVNGRTADSGATSVWADSFHTAPGLMRFKTAVGEDGTAVLEASYPAPEGPDWGWRIVIDPTPAPDFHMVMFNITPEGEALKAVEVVYQRLTPTA